MNLRIGSSLTGSAVSRIPSQRRGPNNAKV